MKGDIVLPRPKKKPDYNSNQQMQYLLSTLADVYGDGISLRALAAEFDMTLLKVRKLLITAGVFSSDISKQVNDLYQSGRSVAEIMKIMSLSRASVHSYLPYKKSIYNMEELSLDAERCRMYRRRRAAVKRLMEERENVSSDHDVRDVLWSAIISFENYPFATAKGLKFRYTVRGNEMFIDRKEKSVTRSSVELAYRKAQELGCVTGPKQLGVFGASYLYPVFVRLGFGVMPVADKYGGAGRL